MAYRYNLNDRVLSGSMAPRLNPEMVNTGLNTKLGPRLTNERNKAQEPGSTRRRDMTLLPPRFDRS